MTAVIIENILKEIKDNGYRRATSSNVVESLSKYCIDFFDGMANEAIREYDTRITEIIAVQIFHKYNATEAGIKKCLDEIESCIIECNIDKKNKIENTTKEIAAIQARAEALNEQLKRHSDYVNENCVSEIKFWIGLLIAIVLTVLVSISEISYSFLPELLIPTNLIILVAAFIFGRDYKFSRPKEGCNSVSMHNPFPAIYYKLFITFTILSSLMFFVKDQLYTMDSFGLLQTAVMIILHLLFSALIFFICYSIFGCYDCAEQRVIIRSLREELDSTKLTKGNQERLLTQYHGIDCSKKCERDCYSSKKEMERLESERVKIHNNLLTALDKAKNQTSIQYNEYSNRFINEYSNAWHIGSPHKQQVALDDAKKDLEDSIGRGRKTMIDLIGAKIPDIQGLIRSSDRQTPDNAERMVSE